MKPLHGEVRTCADADEELDRLSRDLATERARAEKAEAERADWKQAATTHNETIGILGDRLAAAQKRIETLEGARPPAELREVMARLEQAKALADHRAEASSERVEYRRLAAAALPMLIAFVRDIDAVLASPSESAPDECTPATHPGCVAWRCFKTDPPKDQGAGRCHHPVRNVECDRPAGHDGEHENTSAITSEELKALLDGAAPGADELARSLKQTFRPPGDLVLGSAALAQPPAPQEGLFEKGARAMRELAAGMLQDESDRLQFSGAPYTYFLELRMWSQRIRALPLPAEPSAPQAVAAPQDSKEKP